MSDTGAVNLPIVDAYDMDAEHRAALKPGELMRDREGRARRLPRFFFEVDSWETAKNTQLSPHFALWEFMDIDVRELSLLRQYPRYIPCAVTLMAAQLELLRNDVNTFVHISANGGYRSPSHRLSAHATPHCWGTAVNIFKIGDDLLMGAEPIKKYNRLVTRLLPTVWVRPYGSELGAVDDHLHLDLGYVTLVPREAPSEEEALAAAGGAREATAS